MIRIGVIGEDQSDIEVIRIVVSKLTRKSFLIRRFVGHGCGKIIGKCAAWAENLSAQGCELLILLHDLDTKAHAVLMKNLTKALGTPGFKAHIIVIPVRELEAWLLSDHKAIETALKLRNAVSKIANPEAIVRPKEYLRDLILRKSNNATRYINTVHNLVIAHKASMMNWRRCKSFLPLEKFIQENV